MDTALVFIWLRLWFHRTGDQYQALLVTILGREIVASQVVDHTAIFTLSIEPVDV